MKKFQFRLEPLRKYREFLERQKQLEVAKARFDVLSCEQSIENTRRAFSQGVEDTAAELEKGMDAGRFMRFRDYLSGLEQFRKSEEERRGALLGVLSHRQKELAQKTVEKKAIEKLKVRQKEAYYEAMLKAEQKAVDDIVILRQARKLTT